MTSLSIKVPDVPHHKLTLSFLPLLLLHGTVATAQLREAPSVEAMMQRLRQDEQRLADWPELRRYRDENARITPPARGEARVVFMGDSITDWWGRGRDRGEFFPGKPYLNRGIAGQTTGQMLLRFRADVVALKPRVVVILAGTNDIAGNDGPATDAMIEDNIASLCEVASANGIRVVLASLLPVNALSEPRSTEWRPPVRILALNDWLLRYPRSHGYPYVDYHAAMVDANGLLKAELSNDGLHPNARGYAVMAPLVEAAIARALSHSRDR